MKSKLLHLVFLSILILNCKDQTYPIPVFGEVTIEKRNLSISELKKTLKGHRSQITKKHIIEGVITANDKGGNFYKEIYIQDESGGISLKMHSYENEFFHNKYTKGKALRVFTDGLYLEKIGQEIKLGSLNGDRQFIGILHPAKHITIEKELQALKIRKVKIEGLKDEDIGTLVEIKNVRFNDSLKNTSFFSENHKENFKVHILKDCQGNKIEFVVNRIALFKNEIIPESFLTIKGILTKYSTNYQLKIRNLNDIKKSQEKCPDISKSETSYNQIIKSEAQSSKINFLDVDNVNKNKIKEDENTSESQLNQHHYTDLIFYQYVRLRGTEKYLGIYNGAENDIDLLGYQIERIIGPRTKKSKSLEGTLKHGEVLVLRHPEATSYQAAIKFDKEVMSFNSKDQILLKKHDTIIDKIGDKNWIHNSGNKNLRRKEKMEPNSSYYVEKEWEEISNPSINNPNTFSSLNFFP